MLEKEGVLTAMGKTRWYESNISKILKNPFYAGILEYHKQFTPDFLEQKKINNFGEIDRLRVDGRHEPIVTLEEFNRVQEIMESKRLKILPTRQDARKKARSLFRTYGAGFWYAPADVHSTARYGTPHQRVRSTGICATRRYETELYGQG